MKQGKVNQKAIKALSILFEAGYTNEKEILSLTLDQILQITSQKMTEVCTINELQKALRERRFFAYLMLETKGSTLPKEDS
ncbi:ribosomal protein L11 [Lachnospiraceae bacterium PFB1-21]